MVAITGSEGDKPLPYVPEKSAPGSVGVSIAPSLRSC